MTAIREQIKKVLDERANLWTVEGQPLADIAAERSFTDEERGKSEQVDSALLEFKRRLDMMQQQLAIEEQVRDFAAVLASDPAVRSAFETELRSVLVAREKPHADLTFTGLELKRALSVGTPSAGGNAVPTTMLDQLIAGLRNFSSVLNAGATIFTTASGEEIKIPRVATFGAAAQVGEATNVGGTDPTFDQVAVKSYKLGEYVGVSRELIEDAVFDVEGFVINLIAENIGLLLGSRLTVGTGVNQTTGLVTAATAGVTGAAGVFAPTFDNLIDLEFSVPAPYRLRASWLIADLALAGISKIKDGNGQYMWQPAVQIGQPDILRGKPVFADPNMAGPAAGARPVAFGDVSKYWVRFVNSLRVDRSEHALFGSDQVAFRGVLRADGVLTDASAVKVYQSGTA